MNLSISGLVHGFGIAPTLLPDWLDPQKLLEQFGTAGFWIAVAIIFAECGLLIGFFLPGDSLLFVVGLLIAQSFIEINIWIGSLILFISAITGNLLGYWVGKKVGPPLFSKKDSKIFKQEYVVKASKFFDKYGGRAIILARFVPIVRTFITAIAGVAGMPFRVFAFYSAIGGLIWAGGVTIAGYFFGNFGIIKDNLEIALILIVLISFIPVIIDLIRHRSNAHRN